MPPARYLARLLVVVALLAIPSPARGGQGYESGPMLGMIPKGTATPRHTAFAQANMTYHGGPVMHKSITHAIFWEPTGGPAFPSGYIDKVTQYFDDVAADSGLKSNVYSVGTQYDGPPGQFANYKVRNAGPITLSDDFPTGGCSPPLGYSECVTDSDIKGELASLVTSESLPIGMKDVYFVFLPEGVDTCGGSECASDTFCAYHSYFKPFHTDFLLYANMPFGDVDGCDSSQEPQGSRVDATLDSVSHEHNEAITDPTDGGWYSSGFNENGDKCVDDFGNPKGGSPGTYFNQSIHGNHYWLQSEWSNFSHGCKLRKY